MNSSQSKVFGIGLSKTGTTSLARALEILGYNTRDYLGVTRYSPGDLTSIDLDEVNANDAFTDTPIPSFYRELDKMYPGSKFILTVRDMDGWLKSCKKQFTQKLADKQNEANINLFMDLYGCFVFDEEKFIAGYKRFVSGALLYFKDRPDDLQVLDVTGGEGWDKLCSFLGTSVPDAPFPRANVTRIRWININDVVTIALLAGEEALQQHSKHRSNPGTGSNQGIWPSGIGKPFMEKARHLIYGGTSGLHRALAKKARKIILKGLGELNARIPIVAGENHGVSYSERSTWNHLWLVDFPVASNNEHENLYADFVISIALIEDSRPILGVVYAPVLDKVYYATVGEDAFMVEHDNAPVSISRHKENDTGVSPTMESNPPSSEINQIANQTSFNKALTMCMVAEGKLEVAPIMERTMEWQTAGAHVILNSCGKKVIITNTGEELTYNKERFENGPIFISRHHIGEYLPGSNKDSAE